MFVLSLLDFCLGLFLFALFYSANCQKCPEPNGYFPNSKQCDAYLLCKDGVPKKKLCPDGLNFNENIRLGKGDPCSYPQEVECGERNKTQKAKPSKDCPRQYAIFKSEDTPSDQCGDFTNCAAGRAFKLNCPEGLAFDNTLGRCNWPDEVEDCDAEAFIGFKCPSKSDSDNSDPGSGSSSKSEENEIEDSSAGSRPSNSESAASSSSSKSEEEKENDKDKEKDVADDNPRYANEEDCRKFYVCVKRKPRAYSCPFGQVFNSEKSICDKPSNVSKCTEFYPKDVLDAVDKIKSFDKKLLSI